MGEHQTQWRVSWWERGVARSEKVWNRHEAIKLSSDMRRAGVRRVGIEYREVGEWQALPTYASAV